MSGNVRNSFQNVLSLNQNQIRRRVNWIIKFKGKKLTQMWTRRCKEKGIQYIYITMHSKHCFNAWKVSFYGCGKKYWPLNCVFMWPGWNSGILPTVTEISFSWLLSKLCAKPAWLQVIFGEYGYTDLKLIAIIWRHFCLGRVVSVLGVFRIKCQRDLMKILTNLITRRVT